MPISESNYCIFINYALGLQWTTTLSENSKLSMWMLKWNDLCYTIYIYSTLSNSKFNNLKQLLKFMISGCHKNYSPFVKALYSETLSYRNHIYSFRVTVIFICCSFLTRHYKTITALRINDYYFFCIIITFNFFL